MARAGLNTGFCCPTVVLGTALQTTPRVVVRYYSAAAPITLYHNLRGNEMITTLDKAIVAILGGVVSVLAAFGIDLGVSQELVASIGAVITGILVYIVPNKAA